MSNDEIIELTTLCSALADGTLTAAQKERLNALLRDSEEARQFHVRYTDLSASLYSYAAEMQSEAPTAKIVQSGIPWRTTLLAVAAMAMLTLIVWFSRVAPAPLLQPELVALVTGTKDCVWSASPLQAGERVQAGRRLDLKSGFAEITFDSGAQVTLEGPASLVVSSAWDAALVNGALKAKVPEEAIGFRISHPSVEVVDLGTEFSMIADGTDAEVLVLKGSVETSGKGEAKSLVLRETESRRFGRDGVSTVRDHERKFARFARLQKLDRPAVNVDFAHWTFDDATGTPLFKQAKSRKKGATPAQLDSEGTATQTAGRWGKGLNFDGHLAVKAVVPGVSSSGMARTLSFWTRVSEESPLTAASSSILGWGQHNKKHGSMPARIALNRLPSQGPLGAVRTELGRALLVGNAAIRDGRWHHIAIVLVPEANGALHAKQYVDGRFDGSVTTNPGTQRVTETARVDAADTLWLGRSPADKNKGDYFVGALDELFVIDRALSPTEIAMLMRENQPPETMVAGTF